MWKIRQVDVTHTENYPRYSLFDKITHNSNINYLIKNVNISRDQDFIKMLLVTVWA